MSPPASPAERRIALTLVVCTLLALAGYVYEDLRPPAPPLVLERAILQPDSSLYDSASPDVLMPAGPISVDLRSAGVDSLELLPGIGPILAARIVAWREARQGTWQIEDLLEVRGIGSATLDRIRPFLRVP